MRPGGHFVHITVSFHFPQRKPGRGKSKQVQRPDVCADICEKEDGGVGGCVWGMEKEIQRLSDDQFLCQFAKLENIVKKEKWAKKKDLANISVECEYK